MTAPNGDCPAGNPLAGFGDRRRHEPLLRIRRLHRICLLVNCPVMTPRPLLPRSRIPSHAPKAYLKISSLVAGNSKPTARPGPRLDRRLLGGRPDAEPQHKRRLTDGFAAQKVESDCPTPPGTQPENQPGCNRPTEPCSCSPSPRAARPLGIHQFLGRGPAHPLHESADHLPAVDRRVDRSAEIQQDVDPSNGKLASQAGRS